MSELKIIGGGLAGSEAAWQAAESGVRVTLFEMRPGKSTPAHETSFLAELLCSNSLRSDNPEDPAGLLKEELRRLGSLIIKHADVFALPAGKALAVDRLKFSESVTNAICSHPNIKLERREVAKISEGPTIIATGPLTSDPLALKIEELLGGESLYFYDAIAPIIDSDSIDYTKAFYASRYDDDGRDYLNCQLSKEGYYQFYEELMKGTKMPLRDFEEPKFFDGCMPIEEIAGRGKESLRFGTMRPVGIRSPHEGERPFAIVQLRREDKEGSGFNIVGFQTRLLQKEQKRIFRMIPGLEKAEFFRYGSIHRNTFINSPAFLYPTQECKKREGLYFAGQITGVEGYVESVASGHLAGTLAAAKLSGREMASIPETTAIGSLMKHITTPTDRSFQPMNINLGLFPPVEIPEGIRGKLKKKEKRKLVSERALGDLEEWIKKQVLGVGGSLTPTRSSPFPSHTEEIP